MRRMFKKFGILLCILFVVNAFTVSVLSAPADYYGVYSGTYTADDIGDDETDRGHVIGYYSSTAIMWLSYSTIYDEGNGGYGNIGPEGADFLDFTAWSIDNYVYGNGSFFSDGRMMGLWTNNYTSEDGTFTGTKIVSCPQAGAYSGTSSGDGDGTWSITVHADGYISGSGTSEGTDFTLEGGINPDSGYFVLIAKDNDSASNDVTVFGQISNGSVTGGWRHNDGYSGDISGSAGGSGGTGDGGGGGGCFIATVN